MLLTALASPWLVYSAIRKGKYRAGFAQKFLGRVPQQTSDRPCVWLHAVSVGESNDLVCWFGDCDAARFAVQEVVLEGDGRVVGYDRLEPGQFLPIGLGFLIEQLAHRILLKFGNMDDQQL